MRDLHRRILKAGIVLAVGTSGSRANTIRVPEDQPTIQTAINMAASGDVVLVAPGTYTEALNVTRAVTIRSSSGPAVTTLTHAAARSITMFGPAIVTLEGLTLTRTGTNPAGGIAVQTGYLTATNCVFSNCRAIGPGGAVAISGGGGVGATFIGCTFSDNQSQASGGAIDAASFITLQITGCTFLRNSASSTGGAMNLQNTTVSLYSSLLAGNSAISSGGAVYSSAPAALRVSGCTLAGNSVLGGPGSAVYATSGTLTLENCIVWGNTSGSAGTPQVYPPNLSAQYNDVEGGGVTGPGNISANPMFVNAAAGDYHLAAGSPCIDAGSAAIALFAGAYDLDGNPRIADDPTAPNVGVAYRNGAIVDMGAYERPGAAAACPADFNGSGHLEVADIFAFLAAWFAGCP